MTRRKKTRSLKRIHNVKTGSISKLKRAAGADRQTGKRVSNKTKSVYEKYLEQNPDAREKQVQKPKISEIVITLLPIPPPQKLALCF